jgi:hypothetical protein
MRLCQIKLLACGLLQANDIFPFLECTEQVRLHKLHASLKKGLLQVNGHVFLLGQVRNSKVLSLCNFLTWGTPVP